MSEWILTRENRKMFFYKARCSVSQQQYLIDATYGKYIVFDDFQFFR